jgi:hypothetical protein
MHRIWHFYLCAAEYQLPSSEATVRGRSVAHESTPQLDEYDGDGFAPRANCFFFHSGSKGLWTWRGMLACALQLVLFVYTPLPRN